MFPDWFSLPSFFLGMVTICVLAGLWYLWEDVIGPRLKERRRDNQANLEIAKRALAPTPDEDPSPPPSPIPHAADAPNDQPHPDPIKEPADLVTADMPATQAHPAPSTSLIDFTKGPPTLPPVPPPYGGPERRLRSDNPYPELRRRADDRERQEDEAARRPAPTPPPAPARMTRAEERRLREQGTTDSEQSDTERE